MKSVSRIYGDILSVDLTPKDIRDQGFYVVRVIAPGALDIHTNEVYLKKETSKLEKAKMRFQDMKLNPSNNIAVIPHPMP